MTLLEKIGSDEYSVICDLVNDLESPDVTRAEEARQAIQDGTVAVTTTLDSTYEVTVTTGGPAAKIIGSLDSYGLPITATLCVSFGFQPWQTVRTAHTRVLLSYVSCLF
jgi:hypothetical protein